MFRWQPIENRRIVPAPLAKALSVGVGGRETSCAPACTAEESGQPDRRIYHPLSIDQWHLEQVRAGIRKALEALRLSKVDTFLGRQTYEPFPKETEDE